MLLAGGFGSALALLATGFAIGARGWSFSWLERAFGALGGQQFGMGWGAAIALVALTVLGAFGMARRGLFRGDLFVAAAVVLSGSLLALFIVFPVSRALAGAFFGEDGHAGFASFAQRIANERNFGLQCLAGGVRCGVAWNTLFLGVAAAASTTLLGTLLALMAERGPRRYAKPLNVLALLPIITPPFVVGLGLILLFGRAALVVLRAHDGEEDLGGQHRELSAQHDGIAEVRHALDEADEEGVRQSGPQQRQRDGREGAVGIGPQRLRRLLQAGRDALHHAAHDHEGDRREREGLRDPHAEAAIEPARRCEAQGRFQQLVDQARAAEQQDEA